MTKEEKQQQEIPAAAAVAANSNKRQLSEETNDNNDKLPIATNQQDTRSPPNQAIKQKTKEPVGGNELPPSCPPPPPPPPPPITPMRLHHHQMRPARPKHLRRQQVILAKAGDGSLIGQPIELTANSVVGIPPKRPAHLPARYDTFSRPVPLNAAAVASNKPNRYSYWAQNWRTTTIGGIGGAGPTGAGAAGSVEGVPLHHFSTVGGFVNYPKRIVNLSEHTKSRLIKIIEALKRFSEKWFSHVLLLVFLALYACFGAYIFISFEAPTEQWEKQLIIDTRQRLVNESWLEAKSRNQEEFLELFKLKLEEYERLLNRACASGMTSSSLDDQWTFWGALFYSMTVFTTIGYGHLTPITFAGRVATMIYAIFGIPILLMVLADLGKLLTRIIKFAFKQFRSMYNKLLHKKTSIRTRKMISDNTNHCLGAARGAFERGYAHIQPYNKLPTALARVSSSWGRRFHSGRISSGNETADSSPTNVVVEQQQQPEPEVTAPNQVADATTSTNSTLNQPEVQEAQPVVSDQPSTNEPPVAFEANKDTNSKGASSSETTDVIVTPGRQMKPVSPPANLSQRQPPLSNTSMNHDNNNHQSTSHPTHSHNHHHHQHRSNQHSHSQSHHHHHHQQHHHHSSHSARSQSPGFQSTLSKRKTSLGNLTGSSSHRKAQATGSGGSTINQTGAGGAAVGSTPSKAPVSRSSSLTSSSLSPTSGANSGAADPKVTKNNSTKSTTSDQPVAIEAKTEIIATKLVDSGHEFLTNVPFCADATSGQIDHMVGAVVDDEEEENVNMDMDVEEGLDEVEEEFDIPVSFALFLLVTYMMFGAVVFSIWEGWNFFDSLYFVFISMSTIGFGDLVPQHPKRMIGTFIYLLFGLALTSMCINVVQEKIHATFLKAKMQIGEKMGLDLDQIMADDYYDGSTMECDEDDLNSMAASQTNSSLACQLCMDNQNGGDTLDNSDIPNIGETGVKQSRSRDSLRIKRRSGGLVTGLPAHNNSSNNNASSLRRTHSKKIQRQVTPSSPMIVGAFPMKFDLETHKVIVPIAIATTGDITQPAINQPTKSDFEKGVCEPLKLSNRQSLIINNRTKLVNSKSQPSSLMNDLRMPKSLSSETGFSNNHHLDSPSNHHNQRRPSTAIGGHSLGGPRSADSSRRSSVSQELNQLDDLITKLSHCQSPNDRYGPLLGIPSSRRSSRSNISSPQHHQTNMNGYQITTANKRGTSMINRRQFPEVSPPQSSSSPSSTFHTDARIKLKRASLIGPPSFRIQPSTPTNKTITRDANQEALDELEAIKFSAV